MAPTEMLPAMLSVLRPKNVRLILVRHRQRCVGASRHRIDIRGKCAFFGSAANAAVDFEPIHSAKIYEIYKGPSRNGTVRGEMRAEASCDQHEDEMVHQGVRHIFLLEKEVLGYIKYSHGRCRSKPRPYFPRHGKVCKGWLGCCEFPPDPTTPTLGAAPRRLGIPLSERQSN